MLEASTLISIRGRKRGEKLVGDFQTKEAALETDQWEIGDWIVQGVNKFEKQKGKQQVYDGGNANHGVRPRVPANCRLGCEAFPGSSLRKESTLKWSHFKEMAYLT